MFYFKRFIKLLLTLSEFSPLALFWMVKAFLYDFVARKYSFYRLPKAGSEIGLKHIQSDRLKEFGILTGTVNGHKVTVKPHEHLESTIIIHLPVRFEGLNIEFSKPQYRTKNNIIDFTTANKKFNKIFKTIRAKNDAASQISGSNDLLDYIVSFYIRWIFKLESLTIQGNEIFCKLKSPDRIGFFPYIKASDVAPLTTGLVKIAQKLNDALAQKIK